MDRDFTNDGWLAQFLRLGSGIGAGALAGVAAFFLSHQMVGRGSRADDVAYAFGGGVACLVAGLLFWLACRPRDPVSRFKPLAIAVLLGGGLTLLILAAFWWLQSAIFPYKKHPELSYLLGEVGGYASPGVGLSICGAILAWAYVLRPVTVRRMEATQENSGLPTMRLGPLSCLAVASVVGAGLGLLSGTIPYMILGRTSQVSVLAGYLACGVGCLTAGVAWVTLSAAIKGPAWWWVPAGLYLLAGVILCGVGVIDWML